MAIKLYLIDAFTSRPFAGNPAAVCVLDAPANEEWMKLVAREMNLSETAFLHPAKDGFSLRWFTPVVEVALCGHATLASAFTLWHTARLNPEEPAVFHTRSGRIGCRRADDWIEMNFPTVPARPCEPPPGLVQALGVRPVWMGASGMDFLVEVADEETLRRLKPDLGALAALPVRGVIVTSAGGASGFDFLSRFFAPAAGVNEDPVTGSAHCTLGPYWQSRLGRSELVALQASTRGGILKVSVGPDRVLLKGQAVLMGALELYH